MADIRVERRPAHRAQVTSPILRDVVILASAISAGVHAALVPSHAAEGTGAAAGFVVATLVLALVAIALTRRPDAAAPSGAAAVVFAGLLASYALATTTGLPGLHPEPEPVDALGVGTKAVETVGLVAAACLVRRRSASLRSHRSAKGALR